MKLARSVLVSEEEFLSLPESVDRTELLDGEVIVAPSPSFRHQELVGRIAFALREWTRGQSQPVTVGQSPLDVRFAPGRILQPDAFVILGRIPIDHEGPLDVVPVLCVEVLSGNRVYDRVTKRLIYAEAGVREYWIVDPGVRVERRHGDTLAECSECMQRLVTPILPGFVLELEALFAD